jgi:hypothetical protein
MKRTIFPALVVLSLFFLPVTRSTLAQQEAQKAVSPPQWKILREGVKVLKLWDTVGPKWPQVVLLQLSKEEYEKLLKDPKEYINNLNVLGESSTHKVFKCRLAAVKESDPSNTVYLVMFKHEMDTTTQMLSSSNVKP